MKGVYYRVGGFRGQPIDRTERVHVDTGTVVVTNRHIYFAGPIKALRVPYAKIVSFQTFSDGIGIIRDAVSAKPQIFVTGDGWFTYNLVTNLAHFEATGTPTFAARSHTFGGGRFPALDEALRALTETFKPTIEPRGEVDD